LFNILLLLCVWFTKQCSRQEIWTRLYISTSLRMFAR
jgi:hypothetical protein